MSGTGSSSLWNSLEVTKLFVAVLVPIVLLYIGSKATTRLREATEVRTESANELAYTRARQQFLASQNLDITKNYLQEMRGEAFCQRGKLVHMMIVQATSPVVENLTEAFTRQCGISSGISERAIVTQAIEESRVRQVKEIIAGLEGPGRGAARIELRKAYEAAPESLDAPLAEAIRENSKNYQITLGILVALGTINGRWNGKGKLGEAVGELDQSPSANESTFRDWRKRVGEKRL